MIGLLSACQFFAVDVFPYDVTRLSHLDMMLLGLDISLAMYNDLE